MGYTVAPALAPPSHEYKESDGVSCLRGGWVGLIVAAKVKARAAQRNSERIQRQQAEDDAAAMGEAGPASTARTTSLAAIASATSTQPTAAGLMEAYERKRQALEVRAAPDSD